MPQLMGHIVAGFPSLAISAEVAIGIARGGATYLEVQFPFSDPSADGASISNANEVSLANGFRTTLGFELVKKLAQAFKAENLPTKIIIMTYAGIAYSFGVKRFVKKAKESGAWGFIVPDLSIQNDENLFALSAKHGLHNIALIAPNTPESRIKILCEKSSEIIYVVARMGITGEKTTLNKDIATYVKHIKKYTNKSLALGFGITSSKQIRALSELVPIVVVGSAFVREIETNKHSKNLSATLEKFTKELLEVD